MKAYSSISKIVLISVPVSAPPSRSELLFFLTFLFTDKQNNKLLVLITQIDFGWSSYTQTILYKLTVKSALRDMGLTFSLIDFSLQICRGLFD